MQTVARVHHAHKERLFCSTVPVVVLNRGECRGCSGTVRIRLIWMEYLCNPSLD